MLIYSKLLWALSIPSSLSYCHASSVIISPWNQRPSSMIVESEFGEASSPQNNKKNEFLIKIWHLAEALLRYAWMRLSSILIIVEENIRIKEENHKKIWELFKKCQNTESIQVTRMKKQMKIIIESEKITSFLLFLLVPLVSYSYLS